MKILDSFGRSIIVVDTKIDVFNKMAVSMVQHITVESFLQMLNGVLYDLMTDEKIVNLHDDLTYNTLDKISEWLDEYIELKEMISNASNEALNDGCDSDDNGD